MAIRVVSGQQFMVKDQKGAVAGIIPCNENQAKA